MRPMAVHALALVLLTGSLAGCGAGPVADPSAVPSFGRVDPSLPPMPDGTLSPSTAGLDGFDRSQAAQVARDWPGSENERVWKTSYWPFGRPTQWLPPGGLHGEPDKRAYRSGQIDLRAALPYSPATGEVRRPDGSTLSLPLIPAGQVFHGLVDGKSCPGDCPSRLTVSAVRGGTRQVLTTWGLTTIPTWEFTVVGYQDPFVYPAVAPTPGGDIPVLDNPASELATVSTWTATSADGLTLTAHETNGGCERPLPGQVYETEHAVVLIGHKRLSPPDVCLSDLRKSPADFRLSRPVGDRIVLDAYSGRAIAYLPPDEYPPVPLPEPQVSQNSPGDTRPVS